MLGASVLRKLSVECELLCELSDGRNSCRPLTNKTSVVQFKLLSLGSQAVRDAISFCCSFMNKLAISKRVFR